MGPLAKWVKTSGAKVVDIIRDLEDRMAVRGLRLLPSHFKVLEGMIAPDLCQLTTDFHEKPELVLSPKLPQGSVCCTHLFFTPASSLLPR